MDAPFQGICPLCYKPVEAKDDFSSFKKGDQKDTYHARCLHELVQQQHESDDPNEEQPDWADVGEILKNKRLELELDESYIATSLGISVERVRQFESGFPQRDKKLICCSYLIHLDNYSLLYKNQVLQRQLERHRIPQPDYDFPFLPGDKDQI